MITILYVDGEPDFVDLCRIYLKNQEDFYIDACVFAYDALQKIASTPYDIIISDYQMPGMNGIEFLKHEEFIKILNEFLKKSKVLKRISIEELYDEILWIKSCNFSKEDIINNLKKIGFRYVSLDLEGYRSGSSDQTIRHI